MLGSGGPRAQGTVRGGGGKGSLLCLADSNFGGLADGFLRRTQGAASGCGLGVVGQMGPGGDRSGGPGRGGVEVEWQAVLVHWQRGCWYGLVAVVGKNIYTARTGVCVRAE